MKKVLIVLGVIIVGFLGFVASRPGTFHYEKSGVIAAAPDQIFPYLDDFKKGSEWNTFDKADPEMKKSYDGPESGVGAKMAFEGNSNVGVGNLEITNEVVNSSVEMKLEMIKPMKGTNDILYTLTPEEGGTKFTWSMSGKNPFMGKLMGIFIDCEKMIGEQFEQSIQNLKTVVEATVAEEKAAADAAAAKKAAAQVKKTVAKKSAKKPAKKTAAVKSTKKVSAKTALKTSKLPKSTKTAAHKKK